MPPVRVKVAFSVVVLLPRSTVIPPLAFTDGDVEGESARRANVRLPEPAEEDAQHGVGIGGGADGGAGVAPIRC